MSIRPGTQRIVSLLSHFPPLSAHVVHLAGTNGKGSVSALLDSVLTTTGLQTGRFNSPHLVSVEDSIRINGQPIPRPLYDTVRAEVELVNEREGCQASLFELTTATALVVFQRASPQLDVLLIECGMGGVDDATNIFSSEQVLTTVLTAVDLDHQAFLGDTVEEITRAKAGILKPKGLLFVGIQKHQAIRPVVEDLAREREGEVMWAQRSFVGATPTDDPTLAFSQAVLTPLPILSDSPPSRDELDTAEALLNAQLMDLMTATQPLLSESSTETPDSILPAIENIALLSTFIRSLSSSPQPVLLSHLPLPGEHQRDNLSLALMILDVLRRHPLTRAKLPALGQITDYDIQQGVRSTVWEGRCSWLSIPLSPGSSKKVLVDGAHNPSSSRLLGSYISTLPASSKRRTFILSLSHSPPKTPLEVLAPLLRTGDRVALVEFTTPVEGMPWVRPVPIDELIAPVRQLVGDEAPVWAGKLADALEWACLDGEGVEEGIVVVAGSLYLVADVYRLLRSRD